MNMPRFTAQASLYKTSGHYQTDRNAINPSTQMRSAISPAMIDMGGTVDCDSCVGGECVGCLEKMLNKFWDLNPGGGGGGGGGGVGPVEPCVSHSVCSECIPQGPTIFSGGRRFCQHFICQPTASGGCSCTVFKGFERCTPTRNTGVLHW